MNYAPRFKPRETSPSKNARLSPVLPAAVCAIAIVVVCLWRMTLGVDYTDEAFYVGIPWRFALGDRPYVDELNIAQNAALLVTPFVIVYRKIADFSGLFLFLRWLEVAFYCGVGWSFYSLARTRLSVATSLLLGAACVPYLPYGLPGLGYNSIGVGFLALGLFLGTQPLLAPPTEKPPFILRDRRFWAGMCHGAATFAYPTFLFPVVATAVVIFALSSSGRVRGALTYIAGGVGFVVCLSPVLLTAGPAHIGRALAYLNAERSSMSAFNPESVQAVWDKFNALHPDLWKLAVWVCIVGFLTQRWPVLASVLACALPLAMRTYPDGTGALSFFVNMGFTAPLFGLMLKDRKAFYRLLLAVWLPSAFSAAMVSLSSGNGANAVGVGLYPAAMCGGLFYALWLKELSSGWPNFARQYSSIVALLFPLAVAQSQIGEEAVYRDSNLSELTERVSVGPFKGLMTTPERKHWIESFAVEVEKYAVNERSLFYYDFPAGYMFTHTRPLVTSAWIAPVGPARAMYETGYFQEHAQAGDAVFRFGSMGDQWMDRIVLQRCDHVAQGDGYEVWIVRPDGQKPAADPFAPKDDESSKLTVDDEVRTTLGLDKDASDVDSDQADAEVRDAAHEEDGANNRAPTGNDAAAQVLDQ